MIARDCVRLLTLTGILGLTTASSAWGGGLEQVLFPAEPTPIVEFADGLLSTSWSPSGGLSATPASFSASWPWTTEPSRLLDLAQVPTIARPSILSAPPPISRQDVASQGKWRVEEELPISLDVPFVMFSEVKGRDEFTQAPSSKLVARTGMAYRTSLGDWAEVQIGAGPEFSLPTAAPAKASASGLPLPVQSRLLKVEGQCRWALIGPVDVECQGTACPAMNMWEKSVIRQDVRLVVPVLGRSGQMRLGVTHSWEDAGETKPMTESTQFYGGFRFGW